MYILVCSAILTASIVPLAELDASGATYKRIPASIKGWYSKAHDYGIMSGYGLFRVMTGENGRPELILEGTNDPQSEKWEAYHFRYKPGDLEQAPRFNSKFFRL